MNLKELEKELEKLAEDGDKLLHAMYIIVEALKKKPRSKTDRHLVELLSLVVKLATVPSWEQMEVVDEIKSHLR